MDRTSLEQLLGQGLSLAEIGRRFDLHESTVGYWVEKHGLRAVNCDKFAAKGTLMREDLEPLIAQGASIAQIAEAVERSKTTVRHWLREYGLTTRRSEWRRKSIAIGDMQPNVVQRECSQHGLTDFKRRSPSGYRCLKCRSDAVARRRRKVKQMLVAEAGGKCSVCGYSRCIAALEFHHLIPSEKSFSLSHRGVARSLEKARAEASKCALLCANCHAEVEAGLVTMA
jgi:5-methylcytosine-specific restriction endonuclease McrA